MIDWFQQHDVLLFWLGVTSVITMFGTVILVTWFLVRIPADYFDNQQADSPHLLPSRPVWLHFVSLAGKNLLGIVFVIAGIVMLVLPGQGLLTILIGILLLDIPGKRRLQLWLIHRKTILSSINAIRRKAHKPPLKFTARS